MKATVRFRSRREATGARRRASARLKMSHSDSFSQGKEAAGEEGDDELTPQPSLKRTRATAPPAAPNTSLVAPSTPEVHRSTQESGALGSQRRKHALAKSPVKWHGSTTNSSVDMSSDSFSFLFPLPDGHADSVAGQGTTSTPVPASQRQAGDLKHPSSACADVQTIHSCASQGSDTDMHHVAMTPLDGPVHPILSTSLPPASHKKPLRKPGRARLSARKNKRHVRLSAIKNARQGPAPTAARSHNEEESSDDELGFLRQKLALVEFGTEVHAAAGARQSARLIPMELDTGAFEARKKRRTQRSSDRGADAYEATIRMKILPEARVNGSSTSSDPMNAL